MNIDKKKLGKRIKEIRVAEKDTLEAFANKINKYTDGVIKSGKSNVSRWEKGENIPNDITLKAIADIANITVDELLYSDTDFRKLQKIKEKIIKAYKLEDINEVFEYLKQIEEIIDDNNTKG